MFNQMYQQPVYNQGFGAGVTYQQMPQAKMTQPLSKEDINELRRKSSGFTLQIPEIEFKRAQCTHKENGQIVLMDNNDGTVTCSICQETFRVVDYSPEEAELVVQNFADLFQTIKTYYVNIPEVYITAIADILPIVKQMDELYKIALADFKRHEGGMANLGQRGQMGGFNLLNGILSPYQQQGQPMQPGYGQPVYQQPMQQPMQGYGQPVYQQPVYNQPVYQPQGQPISNGLGYNAPVGSFPQANNVQQPIVEQQQNNNQTVSGGTGTPYTKENSVPVKPVTTEKVFNA